MAAPHTRIKLLLICPWIRDVSGLRASLGNHGLDAELVRVDFEAALRGALACGRFDAAIYAMTRGLCPDVAISIVRQHAPRLAVICDDDLLRAATDAARLLRDRSS
ncbi:MAG: hypothetical protein ACM31C_15810 [Acidobacteriota bacterium]